MVEKQNNQNAKILALQIYERIGKPVSQNVTHAMIESFGIREVDVLDDYGFLSLKLLAVFIHKQLLIFDKKEKTNLKPTGVKKIDPFYKKILVFLKYYLVEMFHISPVFFQVVLIIVFGYSLWTYTGFNQLQASAVVMGVVSGFVFSGGFVAVISRQVSFYWNFNDDLKVFQSTVFFLKKGFLFLIASTFVVYLFAYLMGLFPFLMILLIMGYSIMVGSVLLFIAPLYVIKRRRIITFSVYTATIISLILKLTTNRSVYIDHFIGILVLIIFILTFLLVYFNKKKVLSGVFKPQEVFKPFLFYNNYVYLLYGIFFYFFIFLDRLIAWSSPRGIQFSDFILFDKDYEVGMDLALVSYFLMSGIFEYCISTFAKDLDIAQSLIDSKKIQSYSTVFFKNYWKNVSLLFFVALIAAMIQFYLIYSDHGYKYYFHEILSPINIEVCLYGSISYFFFSWAALNVLYFFTLGKPKLPLYGLLIGLLVNILVGLYFSHQFSYHYSVFGLLAGSIVFMLITTKGVLSFFNKIDYYYYAAY